MKQLIPLLLLSFQQTFANAINFHVCLSDDEKFIGLQPVDNNSKFTMFTTAIPPRAHPDLSYLNNMFTLLIKEKRTVQLNPYDIEQIKKRNPYLRTCSANKKKKQPSCKEQLKECRAKKSNDEKSQGGSLYCLSQYQQP